MGNVVNAGLCRLVTCNRMQVRRIKRQMIDHWLHYTYLLCARDHGKKRGILLIEGRSCQG